MKDNENICEDVLFHLRNNEPSVFDELLIDIMIADQPALRWMAQKLFGHLSYRNGLRCFDVDITTLPPRSQFKLFTAILADVHEPRYTLPFLLPLTGSANEVVKEALIARIELLTEEYNTLVLEVLKEEWKIMNAEQQAVFDRVDRCLSELNTQLEKKVKIKEFNPWHSYSKYINKFMSLQNKTLTRNMEAHLEKSSIMHQIATTVVLAKGGGWKLSDQPEVSQLTTFRPSFRFPRSYFISPDDFDYNRRMDQFADWSKFFEGWAAAI